MAQQNPARDLGSARPCANHPDRPATYICQKFDIAMCEECCRCPHSTSHCKFRTQCLIRALCGEDAEDE